MKNIWKIAIGVVAVIITAIVLITVFGDNIKKNDRTGESITLGARIIQSTGDGYRVDASKSTGESTFDNILVFTNNTAFEEDDYVKISGTYLGTTNYQSTIGMDITAHVIEATEITSSSYMEVNSPTIKAIETDETKTQLGYSVTLQKVEFAEEETRVYVKVENAGSAEFSVYDFNAKITQNNKQYEVKSNWEADYPEIQSELLPGNNTEGIMTFPKLEESAMTVLIQGSSDNWDEDIENFIFNVNP